MFFADKECAEIDLQAGFNLAGLACAPEGFTARQYSRLWERTRSSAFKDTFRCRGSFQTVAFNQAGEIQGADFQIVPEERYFISMKQAFSDFEY